MAFKRLVRDSEFWVIVLFVLVLGVRLYIAFHNPYFNYEAYFSLRQVEHIKSTGLPLYNDPLSYGGKTQLFAPLHDYAITLFSLAMPIDIAAKIVPNIFAAALVLIAYFLSFRITKSPKISFVTAFMSGFIPVLYLDINRITVDYLALLLVFCIIYCIFRINERKYIDYALILIFLLVLTTPLAFILILGLLFYLLLLKLENFHVEMKELEIILFFTFLVFWVNLLIYKNAFLSHGLLVIWQNMPTQILTNTFDKLTFLESFYTISIIPLILGLYGFYIVFYLEKNKQVLLLVGFALSSFLLMWFKLLSLVTGLIFLSFTLIILTSFSLKRASEFIKKTRFHKYSRLIGTIVLVLFIITAILPSIVIGLNRIKDAPSSDDIKVLQWAALNTPENTTILSTLDEGNLVAYYANRKNMMDDHYLLTSNIDQRLTDLETIYDTKFETEAVGLLNQYDIKYIFFSGHAAKEFGIDAPSYVNNLDCFINVYYWNNATLYYSKCKID